MELLKPLLLIGLAALSMASPIDSRLQCEQNSTNYQICPDRSKCPEDSTCCLMEDGSYGCCLYSEATCCSDGVHCCPNGYSCDLVNQDCQKNGLSAPLLKKLPSMKSSDQVCPDKSQCPGDSTCCLMDDGSYGCCPYHCRKNELSAPLLKKLPIKNQKGVICPDDTICPKNTTCCKMITGPYGCCPFPNATCCRDGIHCCPHGNRCDMVFYHCISEGISIPMKMKMPSIKLQKHIYHKQSICPGNKTCCKLINGNYGLCPYSEAICCNDGIHCCPNGFSCDIEHQKCVKNNNMFPFVSNLNLP
ncbi:GRN [Cordylochernes scorpioides]|uniref:GRN n=1 Tax=Cordylochernes scorpioides TaxID=51811 RepID=A0ABY6JYX5_9ARAC|nr:GRN [Cordylochernes scorpioides]